jgi:drug/metabolite transporter (DMT)-like permease
MQTGQRARLQLVAAAVLFSTGGAAIKATTLTGWQVAGLRSGIAAIALALFLPGVIRGIRPRALLVAVAYAATLILFVTANKLTTSANTIFLQSTGPLYILLLAPWLLREHIRGLDFAVMLAVGAGLALFFIGTDQPVRTAPAPFEGNVLAALSGFTWALTLMGFRWIAADSRSGTVGGAAVLGNALAALVCLPMMLPLAPPGLGDWLAIGYLGLFQIALAYAMVTWAVPHVPAFEVSILLLVEPALNPIWSWLVHGERPGAWAIAGGILILSATTLRGWWESRSAGRRAAPADA